MALPVNKPTKADIILISTVLFVSVVSVILFTFFNLGNASGFEIKVDGKLHSAYSFSSLKNGEIIEVNTKYGYNKFLYENNSIRCISTDCEDKIEQKAGAISRPNEILVCLPHRLTVQIVGKNNVDGVSY